jgi:hypothetical protein
VINDGPIDEFDGVVGIAAAGFHYGLSLTI